MRDEPEDNRMLVQRLKQMLVNCIGYDGDELSENRKNAYNYYFQRLRGDETEGRSQIVSGDLSSMVEGNLSQMVEPLLARRIAEFCAYDEGDEEQAQLESDCVHEMLFKRQNGFIEVTSAVKDAMLARNAIVKIFIDKRTHVSNIKRSNVDPIVVEDVLRQVSKGADVEVHKFDPETGNLSAKVTKTTRKFMVESLAPENLLIPKNWHRQDFVGIPGCFERHVEPRSTLVERGFPKDKVAKLKRWNNPFQAGADARLPRSINPHYVALDKSQEMVEWYEGYVKMDDGNGASELHRICFAINPGVILEDEVSDLVCYASGVIIINPHTFIGISLYDKLKSVQDSSTALNRALQDNLNATTKNRLAVLDGIVEEDDLTDARVNGAVRVKPGAVNDVRAAVAALQVPDTSGNILLNIENMRRVRSELGGASLDMATGQMQLNDRLGSQGLDRAYSVMEQLAQFMMRCVAHTLIRNMYLIAHETLRTQWEGPISFKRGKTWLTQKPSEWQVREAVTVNLGASPAERARIAAVLDSLLGKMAQLAAAGMEDVLVDVVCFYNALVQWLRINDIDIPEQYVVDPRSDQGREALRNKAMSQKQQSAKQEAMITQAIALEQLRTALEKYKTDSELQFKYYDAVLDAQIEEAKLSTDAVIKIKLAREQALAAMRGSNGNAKSNGGASSSGESADDGGSAETGE